MSGCFAETYHVHTRFCDGDDTVEDIAAAAAAQGVRLLGFSGHSFTAFDRGYCMSPEQTQQYAAAVHAARARFEGTLHILLGAEQDFYADVPALPLDYTIGSVHYLRVADGFAAVDESADIQRETVEKYFDGDPYKYTRAYFDTVARVIDRTGCTVIGHFDLVAKFNEKTQLFSEDDPRYLTPAKEAIAMLCERDAVFEINTGALFNGRRQTLYPAPPLLKTIKEAGGRILLSSDSHRKDTLLFGFERAADMAAHCGFNSRVILDKNGVLQEIAL